MFNKRLLGCTLAAAACLAFGASQAQAATTYNLTLYGDLSQSAYGSFDSGGDHIDYWGLSLTGLELLDDPLVLEEGDTVNATVLLNGAFTIPASEILTSFSLSFGNFTTFPAGDVKVMGPTAFQFGGSEVLANDPGSQTFTSGQIINGATFFPPNNGDITFDSFTSNFLITELHGPVTVDFAQAGYQRVSSAAPEPASWALMLLGFGGLGATIRTRRRLGAGAAAAART